MKALLFCLLLLIAPAAVAAPPAGCESEGGLAARNDIVLCESWESTTWYLTAGRYYQDGEKTSPTAADATDVANTSIIKSGCISGKCLKVRCRAANDADAANRGCTGMLSIWVAIPGTLQEAYFRYYIRTSANWDPTNYDNCAPPCTPTSSDNGGKWPGFGDVRTNADPSTQCGNGGDYSDGINCWSGRLKYRNCLGSGDADICSAEGGGSEKTRLGWYWYVPPANGANNQMFAAFDNQSWGTGPDPGAVQGDGSCGAGPLNTGSTGSDSTSCGKGAAGLKNGKWYLVEGYVKMNTAGTADGIARAWINGTLKYEKTNMKFREVGHDNLHVRGFWLDVHMGGEFVGPRRESYIVIDQLVIATWARVQGWSQ